MVDWYRLLGVYIGYGITIPIYLYLFYKILRRKKRNKASLSLNAHYFVGILAFVFNLIYLPLEVNPISFILYIITVFCIAFSIFFLPFALLNLYKELDLKKSLLIGLIYVVVIILMLSIPNNITYDQTTNWRPRFSWQFFTATFTYVICGILIPSIFLLVNLLKAISQEKLKRKLRIFFIGELLYVWIVLFGVILVNTWEDETYRFIYSFLSVPLAILNAWLLYYGLGKELEQD